MLLTTASFHLMLLVLFDIHLRALSASHTVSIHLRARLIVLAQEWWFTALTLIQVKVWYRSRSSNVVLVSKMRSAAIVWLADWSQLWGYVVRSWFLDFGSVRWDGVAVKLIFTFLNNGTFDASNMFWNEVVFRALFSVSMPTTTWTFDWEQYPKNRSDPVKTCSNDLQWNVKNVKTVF